VSLLAAAVSYQADGHRLLDQVSVAVHPGELVAVLGPNGAGKTTLLKMLCGDLRPQHGEVMLNDRRLRNWSRLALAQQRAVLPQQGSLSFPLTVTQVVRMGRAPYRGQARAVEQDVVLAAMRAADVRHLAKRSYTQLSGGERQRVQLARVLAQIWGAVDSRPRFLLLDEPTTALDLAHQHQVLSIARDMIEQHKIGVLAILHDLNQASGYADRLVLLRAGKVVVQGSTDEVLRSEMLEETFGVALHIAPHPLMPGRHLVVSGADGC